MVNRSQRTLSSPNSVGSHLSLLPWLYRVIGIPSIRIQARFRGNKLYLLCESPEGPSQSRVLALLVRSLSEVDLETLLPPTQPPIYQLVVYGRVTGAKRPQWAEAIHMSHLDRYLENTVEQTASTTSSIVLANLSLARQGRPEAIARYLSEQLSSLGVSVRASVKSVALSEDTGLSQTVNLASVFSSTAALTPQALLNRLWILCESAYSPDMSLMAELIAQKLRDLELVGFQDGLVFSRVRGETRPDWVLRIDLTPPNEMLKEWARWGDVDALTRLLNRSLRDQSVEVAITLIDTTLHISCQGSNSPEKSRVLSAISPVLDTIAPQGIHAAAVYGVGCDSASANPSIPTSPVWIQWFNLPSAEHPALADPTRKLAQDGDLPAISFLLIRLLNPDLEAHLATGGTRIQVRQRENLLHIMADAPICPSQSEVGPTIAKFIKSLEIRKIEGIRIYGRRSGQKQPSWSYGVDFVTRARLVPEAAPEFAASDAYVGDLLTTEPESLTVRPDLTRDDVRAFLGRSVETVQRIMARSGIFTIETPPGSLTTPHVTKPVTRETKLALVWGILGILLTVQADWALGYLVKHPTETPPTPAASETPTPPEQVSLPQVSLQKTDGSGSEAPFNSSGFTGSGQTVITPGSAQSPNSPSTLVASPLRPKAAIDSARSPYPTFNATQLDEKLVLYREFVAHNGAPDVLIVGSSRAMRGIDPVVLETSLAAQGYPGLKVFNFGINGATAQIADLVVRRILPFEKMPKMILFADGLRAFNSGRVDATYNAIAASPGYRRLPEPPTGEISSEPSSPTEALKKPLESISRTNTTIADNYKEFNDRLLETLGNASTVYGQRDKLQTALRTGFVAGFNNTSPSEATNREGGIPLDGQGLIDIDGFLPISNRFNPTTYYQKYSKVPGNSDADYENFNLEGPQAEALRNLAEFTRSRNIPLVVVNLPLTELYLDPYRREREQQFQQHLLRLSAELGFTYRDLLENWKTNNDFFSDPSHLNRYGAHAVAQHLAKDPLIPWKRR
jgi:hypothetical protein